MNTADRNMIRLQRAEDDAKYTRKIANWFLSLAIGSLLTVIAGWVAIIWVGVASIGQWDAFGLIFCCVFLLIPATGGAGALFAYAFDERIRAGRKVLHAERDLSDHLLGL